MNNLDESGNPGRVLQLVCARAIDLDQSSHGNAGPGSIVATCRDVALTETERLELCDTIKATNERLAAIAWLAAWTGLRWSELRELRGCDVHTAACLWLESGVSVTTVQAWMGHADLGTTQGYLHYLGTSADTAALGQINARGHARSTREFLNDELHK